MNPRSLTSRLIATVLYIEFALIVFVSVAAIYYQRRESMRAFDIMLVGRADSILGSVQDAEDAGDNVMLDKSSINIPAQDVYEVREENGRFLGSASGAQHPLSSLVRNSGNPRGRLKDDGEAHNLRIDGRHYRGIVTHGLRLIDPDEPGTAEGGKGTLHRVVVYYAAPLQPVHDALWRAASFFLVADALALLLSLAVVAPLIRRSLRPLEALATQAAMLSPQSWIFKAPDAAYQISELAPLASALDTALHSLERAFQQQRTFVNDAAHELKTAVTILKSSLQLLLFRERTREQYQQGLEACLADCGRMEDLVHRMLLLARIEQAAPAPTKAETPHTVAAEILQQVLENLEPAATVRQVTLSAEIADRRAARISEEDCVVLFTNLLINAIQHSPPASVVQARLTASGGSFLSLTIIDTGEGIAADHLPRIFDRFYRTDASRSRETGGTGLGLAICKAIVETAGGTIQIQSELGQGTTVVVMLPPSLLPADVATPESAPGQPCNLSF
jgi:signal transduction histidine kinase